MRLGLVKNEFPHFEDESCQLTFRSREHIDFKAITVSVLTR
jgi:hypothetical protein